jgi:hypothetical protein
MAQMKMILIKNNSQMSIVLSGAISRGIKHAASGESHPDFLV